MTDKKTEELNDQELDQVTGGALQKASTKVAESSGLSKVMDASGLSKIKKGVVASGGGNGI